MDGGSKFASAVVVVVDRLGAGFLGPYGATWLDTPQFNRLASRSLLCESALADSPDLALAYRAWWTGRHALEPAMGSRLGLPQAVGEGGRKTVLVTDDPQVAELPDAAAFDERILVPPEPVATAAEELEQTGLGRLFLIAIERLQAAREPVLVWIHSRGMAGPWDAPSALRQQFAGEEDPLPPDFVEPPREHLSSDADPDYLLGLTHAYAGQVALVDACLGLLLDALDESPLAGQTLLAVTSPRGYPLGEHQAVGGDSLYGELLHVPLLVRPPSDYGSPVRLQHLVQPPDLFATLAEWLGLPGLAASMFAQSLLSAIRGEPLIARELAYASGVGRLLRTPAWLLREVWVDEELHRKLFAKPDDRWEVNEVASHCGEIAEQLAAAGDRFRDAAAGGNLASVAPLAAELLDFRR